MRILKQNFQQLGSIFGGVLVNAFKPIVTALNVVIGKFIQFAKVVSDSLGKIFGWTYNAGSGGGGVTSDLETGADAAEGISDGTHNSSTLQLSSKYLPYLDEGLLRKSIVRSKTYINNNPEKIKCCYRLD